MYDGAQARMASAFMHSAFPLYRVYKLEETQPPSLEALETACAIFRAEGLNAY